MGGGHPTCGFVYKMVDADGRPVQKRSPGKATVGGRKRAFRNPDGTADVVTTGDTQAEGRLLQSRVVASGVRTVGSDLRGARRRREESLAALGPEASLALSRR